MANDEHLHKAFAFFDLNKSGYLEIEDLRDTLNDEVNTSSEEVINAIMHDVDTDKVIVYIISCSVIGIQFELINASSGRNIHAKD